MNKEPRSKLMPRGATHIFNRDSRNPFRRKDKDGCWFAWVELHNSWVLISYPEEDQYVPVRSGWDGEGLPPIGTVCEFIGGTHCPDDPFDKDLREGMPVTIIAHFDCGGVTLAAFTFNPKNHNRGTAQVEQGNYGCFRPFRTPEQITADERLDAIQRACVEIDDKLANVNSDLNCSIAIRSTVAALIDAGYRKVGE